MSFWQRLFGNSENSADNKPSADEHLLEMVEVEPGLRLPRFLHSHLDEIKATGKETVRILATPASDISLRQSKFAHYPCLPKGFAYPRDKTGAPLFPLAQINFSEVPALSGFPSSGYLQFYIGLDETYGLTFNDAIPDSYKILFFEEIDVADAENDLAFLDDILTHEYSPVSCPHRLTFQHTREYIGLGSYEEETSTALRLDKLLAKYPTLEDKLDDIMHETFSSTGHKLGGYPYFTQEDPRNYNKSLRGHQLLFQMDSDEHIMWGDAGVANFFIHPDKLAVKDFSDVFYTWDCS